MTREQELRQVWTDTIADEIARRAAAPEAADNAARQRLVDELEAMAERILAVKRLGDAEAIEQLLRANADWSIISEISNVHDLSPAEAIAMVLPVDQKLAMKMLNRLGRAHGYA